MTLLDYNFAKNNGILVKDLNSEGYQIMLAPYFKIHLINEIQRKFGISYVIKNVDEGEFEKILQELYSNQSSEINIDNIDSIDLEEKAHEVLELLNSDNDAPVVNLINSILTLSIQQNASDIHIEPDNNTLCIRFRINGILTEKSRLPLGILNSLITRIKVISNLDVSEKRLPQDGRLSIMLAGKIVDLRVSILPIQNGERIVLRLLNRNNHLINLKDLGMNNQIYKSFLQLLRQPNGLVLITGPTGSGKTTSLYAGLQSINKHNTNILTIEDPVEFNLEGIGQMQVNSRIGMTFANGLRSILRQDPDIVLVGEIRDQETAEVALRASLTGHLVLSTLHTNNAAGAIIRLLDMKIESYLLASTLRGVINQRLVKLLCENCKYSKELSNEEKELIKQNDLKFVYHAKGCPKCDNTGYKGRIALYEMLIINHQVEQAIRNVNNEDDFYKLIKKERTLGDESIELLKLGKIDILEVEKVFYTT